MLCSTKQETLYTVYINIYIYMCKYIIYIYLFAFYRFLLPFGSVTTIVHFLRQGVGLFFVFFFFFLALTLLKEKIQMQKHCLSLRKKTKFLC